MTLKIPPFVQKILSTFQKANFEIYIVGGAVRDLLMIRPVTDWDFTTNAIPEKILQLFPEGFYDNQFGTVGVTEKDKPAVYEITTFRKEIGYTDRRHPDKVTWGKTLEEDLARRDFTINAMALKNQGSDLIDPYQGQKDIQARIIRAVGDPDKRFQEDALRMMRAIRLSTQLGFAIEEKTFQAIKNNKDLLDFVSAERIRDELLKLLSYEHGADGYLILRNSGLAQKILPEVERGFGIPQKSPKRHHLYDVGTHSVLSLKNCRSCKPIVKLATLLHDVGKPAVFKQGKDGVIIRTAVLKGDLDFDIFLLGGQIDGRGVDFFLRSHQVFDVFDDAALVVKGLFFIHPFIIQGDGQTLVQERQLSQPPG